MKEVYLSPIAERRVEELLEYLLEKWSLRVRNSFLDKLVKSFQRVSEHPESCPEIVEITGVRRCVISKEASFFYREHLNSIEIITIIDNRQDPNLILLEADF